MSAALDDSLPEPDGFVDLDREGCDEPGHPPEHHAVDRMSPARICRAGAPISDRDASVAPSDVARAVMM